MKNIYKLDKNTTQLTLNSECVCCVMCVRMCCAVCVCVCVCMCVCVHVMCV